MLPRSRQADVLIVGAGIVGAACAREFAAQGLTVTVIERGAIGGGATAASMGHLLVVDAEGSADDTEFQLSHRSMQLWQDWLDQQPQRAASVEHHRLGTLWLAADEEELQLAARKAAWLQGRGLQGRLIDAAELQRLEPHLRPGLSGALHVPADARVYPPKVAAQWLQEAGATVLRGEVTAIEPHGGLRLRDGRRLWGAMTVLCGGLDSRRFAPPGALLAKKGHLAITQRHAELVRHQLVELGYIKKAHLVDADTVSFNVQPRPGGQLLIGSSRQIGKEDMAVELPMLGEMLRCATGYLPVLEQLSLLRCWTGLRPASADGQPLIGAHPALRHCWLACGHEGLGITTSLASAELLADLALGREVRLDAAPYSPARFQSP
ncbi:FAD-dependent oxidoreductase [Paucibacter sp. APW11]|uniref:FAD-dependent oxidoreductase n=1 Tax=Roseateles aquae TaxID=3077235 RepID=A0ABU3PBY6_9BURK|nr:FAD-dependent oxidoreductase [Paucibacter sp. APW11]MDT8999832.1 FAD-dependent oxidoreductase [Paucibacter sp. APW11]